MPPKWHEAVVHRVDGAARIGRHGREQRRGGDAEADLLALHVAAGLERAAWRCVGQERREGRIVPRLRPVHRHHTNQQEDAHRGKQCPALPFVAHHAAEHIGESGSDPNQEEHLHKIGQRGWVLVGMGGVGVEEATAVGAENLDHFL
jgi:hypothetical protein